VNEEALGLFGVLAVVIFLFAAFYFHSQKARATDATYHRVANRFSGIAAAGGVFGPHSFTFEHHGVWVKVDAHRGGENESDYTQVHLAWPDPKTRCEVYPEYFSSRLGKMVGLRDVKIGSHQFDKDFIITGSSATKLRSLLTQDVQEAIYTLRRMPPGYDIFVSIAGGQMLVKKLSLFRQEEALTRFVEAVLELYDRARGRASMEREVEFVSELKLGEPKEVVCQICGEAISQESVRCRRCKTPHHADCWEYFGGCSTFGCGEKRYIGKNRKNRRQPS
jgi:hypothetical protein